MVLGVTGIKSRNVRLKFNFADDNFCVLWNRDLSKLIIDLEKNLKMITKWLKGSGLLVNEAKTEIS